MLKYVKVRDVKDPNRGTPLSAGIDFFVPNDHNLIIIEPQRDVLIASGIHVKIPADHVLIAFNKSGIAVKKGLVVGACVIDEDYQGEIHIHLTNSGDTVQTVKPGDKIVQFLLLPVALDTPKEVSCLELLYNEITQRGSGGFGSTGGS